MDILDDMGVSKLSVKVMFGKVSKSKVMLKVRYLSLCSEYERKSYGVGTT